MPITPNALFEPDRLAWLNVATNLEPESLRGRVVMIKVFQMLCPGCVSHALPQAQRVHDLFSRDDVIVIGLHSVFEHHDAQGQPVVLKAFLHENRLTYPIAIDTPGEGPLPKLMQRFVFRGTPTTFVFDRSGQLRLNHFGAIDDLRLGVALTRLVVEAP